MQVQFFNNTHWAPQNLMTLRVTCSVEESIVCMGSSQDPTALLMSRSQDPTAWVQCRTPPLYPWVEVRTPLPHPWVEVRTPLLYRTNNQAVHGHRKGANLLHVADLHVSNTSSQLQETQPSTIMM